MVLRKLASPLIRRKMNYSYNIEKIERPSIVISNHTTNWDPVFLGMSFAAHMYFVASEHVLRWGFASVLLKYVYAPIIRLKGSTAAKTAMEVLRAIKSGASVCIFAEGDRTFNGLTREIVQSTGKLVRISGADLITYRLEGGYLASPRWSKNRRRGKIKGSVIGRYPAAELKEMSPEKINEIIQRDIHEDANARQLEEHAKYTGKDLAEYLETAVFLCPGCMRIGTLKSQGSRISCTCGMSAGYDEYGMLQGHDFPFGTVTQWDLWQRQQMPDIVKAAGDAAVCSDDGISLYRVEPCISSELITTGRLSLTPEHLSCGSMKFPLDSMTGLSITALCTLTFASGHQYYEIKSDRPYCAVKYEYAYDIIRESR